MSEIDERQSASVAAPPSPRRDLAGCPPGAYCVGLATSWFLSGRPLAWLVGLCAALAWAAGCYAVAAGYGTADRDGVRWRGCRLRWDDVVGVRLHQGRWLVETTRGDRAMPAWLVNSGFVASEILRRTEPASAVTAAVDDATLRDWLGLGATGRLVVNGGRPLARRRALRLCLIAGLALLLLGVGLELASADMPGIPMAGMFMLLMGTFWGTVGIGDVSADEAGLQISGGPSASGRVPWSSLLAVGEVRGGYVLHTTSVDILIPGTGSAQSMLRRAAERYLAERGPRPASLDEPTDAALSPAARLTGETERGLSLPEYGGTGRPAGERVEPPTASATPNDAH